jgi:hypothetical protein
MSSTGKSLRHLRSKTMPLWLRSCDILQIELPGSFIQEWPKIGFLPEGVVLMVGRLGIVDALHEIIAHLQNQDVVSWDRRDSRVLRRLRDVKLRTFARLRPFFGDPFSPSNSSSSTSSSPSSASFATSVSLSLSSSEVIDSCLAGLANIDAAGKLPRLGKQDIYRVSIEDTSVSRSVEYSHKIRKGNKDSFYSVHRHSHLGSRQSPATRPILVSWREEAWLAGRRVYLASSRRQMNSSCVGRWSQQHARPIPLAFCPPQSIP